jgi:hypothetical protein
VQPTASGWKLAGARADLEHRAALGEHALQDREDRAGVSLAGFGERP